MGRPQLTLKGIRARPVVVPLRRPVVSKVGLFHDWPGDTAVVWATKRT